MSEDAEIRYRFMMQGEEARVCSLIEKVFNELVAPDYGPEGVEEFLRFADPRALAGRAGPGQVVAVAEQGPELVGAIEMLACDHISLLFVSRRGVGIARGLVRTAVEECRRRKPDLKRITVSSSPFAEPVYRRMGFEEEGPFRKNTGSSSNPWPVMWHDRPHGQNRSTGRAMEKFLRATEIIDWKHPDVLSRARALSAGQGDPAVIAGRCFAWVRDAVMHSRDHSLSVVTCKASEVLRAGSGFCYAKSHLLAALLRANGIPAGFCYQRLSKDDLGPPFCLHALGAVFLPGIGWYRVDARGNREDVDAQFTPPKEKLAFSIQLPGEADFPEIWPDPLPVVVDALKAHATAEELWEHLPDVEIWTR